MGRMIVPRASCAQVCSLLAAPSLAARNTTEAARRPCRLLDRESDHQASLRGRDQSLLPERSHESRVRVLAIEQVEHAHVHPRAARTERGSYIDGRVLAERMLV